MNSNLSRVRLSPQEVRLLTELSRNDQAIKGRLNATVHGDSDVTLALDRDTAEKLRDLLTIRPAQVGLDSEYKPTQTGKMLEELIDKLFQP